ncbi:hypothetical protein [Roseobacter sp.]|uniref:hypothetical protein n=1 Tax=Roseobacter sp. TaxID=1907202 RepID=UPI0029674108|nr:hypothetical protein [Roseobacter sp.]MDW3181774.1 hypothetical protein [Roseobacter sp.]
MVRVSPPTSSAASGELSSLMFARNDYARFKNGLRKCRGFIVLPEGGATRLPGTRYLGNTHLDQPARLMRFAFKDEDAVLLEWTNLLLRFWRNAALVPVSGGSTPYSIATPYTLAQANRLQSLLSSDRIYLTEGELPPQRLSRFALDNWTIEDTPFENGPFSPRNVDPARELTVSGVSGSITVTSNFALFEAGHVGVLFEIREVDTSDTAEWSADIAAAVNDRFYYNGNVYRISGFDGGAGTGTTGVNPPVHSEGSWLAEKGGPIFQFLSNGTGIFKITGVTNAQSATASVIKRLPEGMVGTPSYRWAEGAWSDLKGYPRAIGSYRQRHIYGRTPGEPRTLWHTVIGGTVDMSANGADDDGFSYILDSDRRENGEITYIIGAGGVVNVGTTAGEFFGSSSDADRAYAEATAIYDDDTDVGSAEIEPIKVGGKVIFLDKTLRSLVTLLIGEDGKFQDEQLTQIARHILAPGAVKLVYQKHPVPMIWAVLSDGSLVGCTFILKQQVLGFHRHNLAGGSVIDVEVMPSDDGSSEVLELVVARTIGGQLRHFREQMLDPFVDLDGEEPRLEDAWHLFAAIRHEGAAVSTLSGLDHLEGETVVAWTNVGAMVDLVVTGGEVTFDEPVTSAIVGLDATPDQVFETLDVRAGTPDGGDEGRKKTHRATGVHLHRTAGGTFSVVGIEEGVERASDPEPLLRPSYAVPISLKSGVFDLSGHKGWASQSYFRFKPEPGAPLTVLARTSTMMVSDD